MGVFETYIDKAREKKANEINEVTLSFTKAKSRKNLMDARKENPAINQRKINLTRSILDAINEKVILPDKVIIDLIAAIRNDSLKFVEEKFSAILNPDDNNDDDIIA